MVVWLLWRDEVDLRADRCGGGRVLACGGVCSVSVFGNRKKCEVGGKC